MKHKSQYYFNTFCIKLLKWVKHRLALKLFLEIYSFCRSIYKIDLFSAQVAQDEMILRYFDGNHTTVDLTDYRVDNVILEQFCFKLVHHQSQGVIGRTHGLKVIKKYTTCLDSNFNNLSSYLKVFNMRLQKFKILASVEFLRFYYLKSKNFARKDLKLQI